MHFKALLHIYNYYNKEYPPKCGSKSNQSADKVLLNIRHNLWVNVAIDNTDTCDSVIFVNLIKPKGSFQIPFLGSCLQKITDQLAKVCNFHFSLVVVQTISTIVVPESGMETSLGLKQPSSYTKKRRTTTKTVEFRKRSAKCAITKIPYRQNLTLKCPADKWWSTNS